MILRWLMFIIGDHFLPRYLSMQKVKVDTFKAYFTKGRERHAFFFGGGLNLASGENKQVFVPNMWVAWRLVIVYGRQFQQRGEYSSVCNWNLLSDKTIHLHNILKRRIKNIYLGETDSND